MSETFFRGRRLRKTAGLRSLARETVVHPEDLIYPMFAVSGTKKKVAIPSMEGIHRFSVDKLDEELRLVRDLGISAVLLFGVVDDEEKNDKASAAWAEDGPVQRAVQMIKEKHTDLTVITDVCICGYTDHGHCGYLGPDGIDNDASLVALAQMALSHAKAGADIVAPSDMMDGRVRAIRNHLDSNGFSEFPLLSYAAKFASAFYGPFREAAASAPKQGDRKSYQLDPANRRQAMEEIGADIEEGADMVMVKPALAYLDVITEARARFDAPVLAYNVSGEYSMVKAAAQNGWIDERAIVAEILTAIRRAGADKILTYHAKEFLASR